MNNHTSVDAVTSTKLVFVGPMGAGKTTAIASIADSIPVSTDVPISGQPTGDKTSTTVAMDFATVRIDGDHSLFLYGCPGQDHFAFMRPILLQGAVGAVVILNGEDPHVVDQCCHWSLAVAEVDPSLPMVVGITQVDRVPDFDLMAVRKAMRAQSVVAPVFTFDARSQQQTIQLVRALLLLLE